MKRAPTGGNDAAAAPSSQSFALASAVRPSEPMTKSARLRGKVIVITGASSGIGRAAAVAFASAGCRVAVAARREVDLEETARLCREAGGEALVVTTDVSQGDEVRWLFDKTIAAFGRIDVWVNNAGVTLFGLLAELPFEEHKRVIETNLFGSMHGARVVLPYFKNEERGVLINVSSVLGLVGQAFVPSYVISKFGLRGLTEALRCEVAEYRDIHVCTLLPYAVDTPHFESGANIRGKRARPLPPTQSPEKVARALVDLAARPRRERLVPRVIGVGLVLHWLFPRTTERLLVRALARFHFEEEEKQLPTEGNLRVPQKRGDGHTHGVTIPAVSTPVFAAWVAKELVKMIATPRSRTPRLRPAEPTTAGA